jgi:hypothetical protein
MAGFDHFETLVEQLVEGTFGRLFPPPLHLSELVRRLARAMADGRATDTAGQVIFPNRYWVFLNPIDHEALGAKQPALLAELSRCLNQLADEGDGKFDGQLLVTLHPDTALGSGQVEVRAAHTSQLANAAGDTREVEAATTSSAESRQWALRLGDRVFRLGEPVVRLGRALSNDIILDDQRVSRRHAQLRWREGRYYLSDLNSARGVQVNGRSVPNGEELPLGDGDRIDLAGLVLIVTRDDDQGC